LTPSSKFNPSIKNKTTGWSSNQAYSRSSFILLNNGSGYNAYVMTLIADSAYLKNDLSKLDRNKYNKRDANYSGLVLYFTPKGKYVGGWRYKDGHIVSSGSQSNAGVKVQSTGSSKLIIMKEECYDYWLSSPSGDVMIYLFTACSGGDGGTGDSGGPGSSSGGEGSGAGSGGGSGSASSPTPPPPCNNAPPIIHSSGNLVVNNVPPDPYPGDGFPPPPTDPCVTETSAVAPNPVKPCALKFKNITSNYMAVAVTGYKFGITDNVFGTKFITFNIQIGMPSYVNIQKAQNAAAAAMQLAEATIAHTHGVDFFLSVGAQGTYSKEFANLVQAQLALVLNAPVQVSNAISAGVPIITYADNKCD
jgi:hypothetical protein